MATPGHTPEHLSWVVRPPQGAPLLFSGGSLIVGGAARTDLISPELTEELTRAQFHSLRRVLAALPDETALYPTHGGGSFCSTGSGDARTSTLGAERATNPVLAITDEDEFARSFPSTFPAAPSYLFRLRALNQAGPTLRRNVEAPPALSPEEFERRRRDALVVDTRPLTEYMRGHIPGALSNAFRDAYSTWLGWLVPLETPLLFVAEKGSLDRVVDESLLVGFERFAGYLEGGVEAWRQADLPLATAETVDAEGARRALRNGAASVDVREPDEFASGHVEGAIPLPLGQLPARHDRLPRDRPLIVYCAHGQRAATAVSLLEREGFEALISLNGGIAAWRDAGFFDGEGKSRAS